MPFGFVCEKDFPLLCDLYELTMAQIYFKKGMNQRAVFDFFIRPNKKRVYYVMAGLEQLLYYLEHLRFGEEEIAYLRSLEIFEEEFLEYLSHFRFSGEVWAVEEGEIVFANEPLVSVKAPLIEVQIIETFLINTLQHPILVATKAARCYSVAQGTVLVDFGLRRAHGTDAGMKAARSAYIAGFAGTSNMLAGKKFGIPVVGTMAHSFILAHKNEIEAFKDFLAQYPENAVLLVDTFDTLQGVKNAIEAVKSMGMKHFKGIRLDSGDIATLAVRARKMLDNAGFRDAKIIVSGGLNEYKIKKLLEQKIPIDGWGVGTELVVSADMPYLDCAYKLVEYADKPKMKLSPHKVTLPAQKQIFRFESGREFQKDIIDLFDASHEGSKKLLQKVMDNGEICYELPALQQIQERFKHNITMLPKKFLDITSDEPYVPQIGKALQDLCEKLKTP
ncbi:nicotinate phosphoribosyltransferase [Nitratiruptor sp. YY08-26]|uniref:nicotinate phosphoribosyltransferase n=1 Tax=unclassified Nitratiruptor TaxID=2624044 RepID=UPI001915C6C7|nr:MULTISPECIES: nicotinate phosphoribosyltransferase [unclassified Nitratiruptor]BCD62442.1 nicotinate phosphoribosyltransferase [Nitratiruptor sp. YY08-13]BCD66378.1 nicotinate phosphoribosyltransferase [Nitratiruptor sp. YY08-26]